jgi:hypothetical protein
LSLIANPNASLPTLSIGEKPLALAVFKAKLKIVEKAKIDDVVHPTLKPKKKPVQPLQRFALIARARCPLSPCPGPRQRSAARPCGAGMGLSSGRSKDRSRRGRSAPRPRSSLGAIGTRSRMRSTGRLFGATSSRRLLSFIINPGGMARHYPNRTSRPPWKQMRSPLEGKTATFPP